MKAIHEILGFTFYIQWDKKGEYGIDQHNHLWHDKKAPVPDNPEIIEIILDTYNEILKLKTKQDGQFI